MITHRRYNDDRNKILNFLGELHKLNNDLYCWVPGYWEIHQAMKDPNTSYKFNKDLFTTLVEIWEEDDEIVAVCSGVGSMQYNPEAHIYIRPNYKFLYAEILDWSEQELPKYNFKYSKRDEFELKIPTSEKELYRIEELQKRGYTNTEELLFKTKNSFKILSDKLPKGYSYITRKEVDDLCELENVMQSPHYDGYEKPDRESLYVHKMLESPLWSDDTELIIKHENKYIAYTTIWVDATSKTAFIDWVGVIPEYQKKGFGSILMSKAVNVAKQKGADHIYLMYNDEPQKRAIYPKVGFETFDIDYTWSKKVYRKDYDLIDEK